MRFKKTKKGFVPLPALLCFAIFALVVVFIVMLSGKVGGSDIDSLTPKKDGCNAKLGVRITGSLNVEDTAFWGVQPEPVKIGVDEVRTYSVLGVFSQDYKWRVCLVNTRTNNKVACDDGRDSHPGSGGTQIQGYVLDFTMPDNDCDGMIDDFDGELEATVVEDGNEYVITSDLRFRNGRWEQK